MDGRIVTYDDSQFADIIQRINSDFINTEVVLIIVVKDPDNKHLCTVTQAMESVTQSDGVLECANVYASEMLGKVHGLFEAKSIYNFSIVQYLPRDKQIRRVLKGDVSLC